MGADSPEPNNSKERLDIPIGLSQFHFSVKVIFVPVVTIYRQKYRT